MLTTPLFRVKHWDMTVGTWGPQLIKHSGYTHVDRHTHTHEQPHISIYIYIYIYSFIHAHTEIQMHTHTHTFCSACHPALTLKFSWIAFKGCQHHHGSRQVAAFRRRVCLFLCVCVCAVSILYYLCFASVFSSDVWPWIGTFTQSNQTYAYFFPNIAKGKRTAGPVIVFFGAKSDCVSSAAVVCTSSRDTTHTHTHVNAHIHKCTHTRAHMHARTNTHTETKKHRISLSCRTDEHRCSDSSFWLSCFYSNYLEQHGAEEGSKFSHWFFHPDAAPILTGH